MEHATPGLERISPTAKLIAYFRSFSDIPYAREVASMLDAETMTRQIHQSEFDVVTRFFGPFAEARYKCFDPFIRIHRNILELAVGASIERGLAIAASGEKIYIGTDLPDVIREARTLVERADGKLRPNHYLQPANVLSYEELEEAIQHFGPRPEVLILHEGLWMFLSAEEQAVFADNVRRILERRGGLWVTPDIWDLESNNRFTEALGPEPSAVLQRIMQRVAALTGRDIEKNYFHDRSDAVRFFNDRGLEVERLPMVEDLTRIASIKKLWGDREREFYEAGLRLQTVWVMRIRR